jgi:hypothetical protein
LAEATRKEIIVKRMLLLVVAALALSAAPAGAINDPFVPGDNCSPDHSQSVGHPAAPVLAGTPAGVPGPGNAKNALPAHNDAVPNCVLYTPVDAP